MLRIHACFFSCLNRVVSSFHHGDPCYSIMLQPSLLPDQCSVGLTGPLIPCLGISSATCSPLLAVVSKTDSPCYNFLGKSLYPSVLVTCCLQKPESSLAIDDRPCLRATRQTKSNCDRKQLKFKFNHLEMKIIKRHIWVFFVI